MIAVATRRDLREALTQLVGDGTPLALVPTMGYLHEGHLSLVDLARREARRVAVSIFVNPLQFGPGEDLDRYPRDLDRDLSLSRARGVDLVFHPSVAEMYPEGEPWVTVDPGRMGRVLCGRFRPGHFRGVLTVVARLLGLFRPRVVVFGRKDYQQVALVRRMVRDLELGVEVRVAPTVREADGLALSSRNVYLSPEERREAPLLFQALRAVEEAFRAGERRRRALRAVLARELARFSSFRLQYGEIVDPDTLSRVDPVTPGAVVAAAGFLGTTRLIDNLVLEE